MGKALDTAQSFCGSVFGQKHDPRRQRRGSAALTGDPEFLFKISLDIRDGGYGKGIFHDKSIIIHLKSFVKGIFFKKEERKDCKIVVFIGKLYYNKKRFFNLRKYIKYIFRYFGGKG